MESICDICHGTHGAHYVETLGITVCDRCIAAAFARSECLSKILRRPDTSDELRKDNQLLLQQMQALEFELQRMKADAEQWPPSGYRAFVRDLAKELGCEELRTVIFREVMSLQRQLKELCPVVPPQVESILGERT